MEKKIKEVIQNSTWGTLDANLKNTHEDSKYNFAEINTRVLSQGIDDLVRSISLLYQEWYESNILTWGETYGIQRSEEYANLTDEEIFDLFLKEVYGK